MKSESTKKPYETPKLSVYGDILEVTQSLSAQTGMDNPTGNGKTA